MTDLNVTDIKTFVGSKDYDLSRNFYVAMGWSLNFDAGDLCELEIGAYRFYLQKYYQRQWCDNTMLHVTVDNAQAWFERATAVISSRDFGPAKVRAPSMQSYGALVTFVWDPSGVLLHFAQPCPAENF